MTQAADWTRVPERGGGQALRLMARIALGLGWHVGHALLFPITLFFLGTSPSAQKRAVRRYLTRALDRPARWSDLWRLYFCFASTLLDRVFLLSGRTAAYSVTIEGLDLLRDAAAERRGVVVLGAHMGSFEALRAITAPGAPVEVRMLMHAAPGGAADALFDSLDPTRAAAVIHLGRPEAMLTAREVLDRGGVIGLLADRAPRAERMIPVPFLGDDAPFPGGPITLAAILKAPVVLGFGLWLGPRRYLLRFEAFAEAIDLPRATRAEALRSWTALYAARLSGICRAHPYNWFNFYDFWQETP